MSTNDINQERLELALEAAGLDLWENDLVAGDVTRKATKIFAELGYTEVEAAAYVEDIFSIVHPDDIALLKGAVHDHLSGVSAQYRCEFRIQAKSGDWIWYANYGKVMDREGRRFIGVTFNIDDRKRKEDEIESINRKLAEQNRQLSEMNTLLQSMATSDSLTGLANRRKLMETGESEVRRAIRSGHAVSLLIADIDLFKQVNDTWGHMAGDTVISAIADTCAQCVRSDIDTLGRIGGEEFAVIMPEADSAMAEHLAQRLCQAVATKKIAINDENVLSCTISIGIASLTPSCTTFRHLLINADKALYRAKDAGRNCARGGVA